MTNYIEVEVLSCAEDIFRSKDPSKPDQTMYRLYMADNQGRVGYVYCKTKVLPGDTVRLGLVERDGRLRLKVLQ